MVTGEEHGVKRFFFGGGGVSEGSFKLRDIANI